MLFFSFVVQNLIFLILLIDQRGRAIAVCSHILVLSFHQHGVRNLDRSRSPFTPLGLHGKQASSGARQITGTHSRSLTWQSNVLYLILLCLFIYFPRDLENAIQSMALMTKLMCDRETKSLRREWSSKPIVTCTSQEWKSFAEAWMKPPKWMPKAGLPVWWSISPTWQKSTTAH